MAAGPIPEAVEHFLADYIPTVAHLEALLLLRAEPDEPWSVELLAARLFITPEQTARVVAHLVRCGLVATGPRGGAPIRYAPAVPARARDVDATAETYRTQLVAVTHFIHAREASPAQAFADAFRLRKD